jgi:hypothetical protein
MRTKRIRSKLTAAAATFALLGAAGTLSFRATSASASQSGQRSAALELEAALRGDLSRYLTDRRTAEHISAVSLASHFRRLQATHQPGHRDHPLRRRGAGTGGGALADRQQHHGRNQHRLTFSARTAFPWSGKEDVHYCE